LALGRAIGETMAVTMLIGNTPTFPRSLWDISPFVPGDSIASRLAGQYNSADYASYVSALTELALVLLLVTIITNSLARLLIWRVTAAATVVRGPDTRPLWRQRLGQAIALLRGGVGFVFPLLIVAFVANWLLTNLLHTAAYLPVQWVGLPNAYAHIAYPAVLNLLVLMVLTLLLYWAIRGLLRLLAPTPTQFAKIVNVLMLGVLGLCALLTIVPLFQILYKLIEEGIGSINWNFFTQTSLQGGMANALLGSAILVSLASLFAVPVGLLAAIYLAENRRSRVGSVIRFIGELLGGVPSIVLGLYIYSILIGTGFLKMSGWAGAFALGVMMLPVIMRASEEALKLVPESIRQASYALGASQWQTVARVILPAALPAIITGVFLAVARIAGETAPLILTAGDNMYFPRSINDRMPSVPYLIYNASREPNEADVKLAWAAALVLLVLVMLLNFGVRVLTGKRVVLASRAD
jgi:phosphate ABC transporter permease subunit PstA